MKWLRECWVALREDASFACKSLARVPTYTTTVVLTLALAIGGVTAVFSVLYAVVLRPLPFPKPDELVAVNGHFDQGAERNPVSPGEFLDIQNQNRSFAKVAAYLPASVNLTGRGEAVRINAGVASAELIRLLGVPPALGRDFAPGEDRVGAAPVAILGAAFHQRVWGGAPDAIGQVIQLNGKPFTVIGVLPAVYDRELRLGGAQATDLEPRDVWLPLTFTPDQLTPGVRPRRFLQVFGRLSSEATRLSAGADMKALADTFFDAFPGSYRRESGWTLWVESLKARGAGPAGFVLSLLLGAVTLVLGAASANVISITLARLGSRRREIAVRTALGATAGRIGLQFLVESVILSVGAGALGVVIGRAGMDGLLAALGRSSLGTIEVSFQLPVLAFALGVSLLTGILAGSVPAWHAARLAPTTGLREGGRSTSAGAVRLRSALVVAQVTVALVLLMGTGVLLRSIVRLTDTSPGFEAQGVYVGQVALAGSRINDTVASTRLVDAVLDRVRTLPGVESVGLSGILPFSGGFDSSFSIEGDPSIPVPPSAQLRTVGGDFFQTLHIPLVAGRFTGAVDTADTPPVAVISQRTAIQYFSGRNPLGMRLRIMLGSGQQRRFTIVGIAGDTRAMGMGEPLQPFVYVPHAQFPNPFAAFVVRAPRLGAAVLPALQAAVAAVDPSQPVFGSRSLQSLVDESLGPRRFTLLLLSVFACLGLLLATLGIYGITSYSVVQRTQELAVRMAMGAEPGSIMRLVLGQALRLICIGLLSGAVLAAGLGQYFASVIYGLSPWDPQAVGVISALLVSAALVAGWIPARRAARLPLAGALRTE